MPRSSLRSVLATATLLSGLSQAQTTVSNVSSSACPTQQGAHIIAARGSLEAPGYGIIGAVKDQVLARVPGSTAESVGYPATLADYTNSETVGVINMRELINNFIANCPGAPLVLMGYSQGAQVAADSLVGQQVKGFSDNSSVDQPLAASTLARTAALVIMGDPSSIANASFHVGNSTKNGDFLRQDLSNFNIAGLASRTQSYCDVGDPYCASGNFSTLSVHLGYVTEYGQQAEDFIVTQIKNFYANGGTTSSGNGTGSAMNGTGIATNGTSSGNGTSAPGVTTSPSSPRPSSANPTSSLSPSASTGAASSIRGFSVIEVVSYALSAGLLAWAL